VPGYLPHSEFLSWPVEDQDKALAFQRHQRRLHTCGTDPSEWITAKGRPVVPPPFEPQVFSCQGCKEIDGLRRALGDDLKGYQEIVLVPVDPDDVDQDQITSPSVAVLRDELEVD
jgi:hypothetical protein